MDISEKNELLDGLSVCYGQVDYLKTLAEENHGDPAMIDRLDGLKRNLKTATDGLLKGLYADWIGDAKRLTDTITESNGAVKQCIGEIKKDVALAQNMARAAGYIDDAVKIAEGLFPE